MLLPGVMDLDSNKYYNTDGTITDEPTDDYVKNVIEGRDPFDLLDELEKELQIHVRPLSWPIGQGLRFKGVYNIFEQQLNLFTPNKQRVT